MGALVFLALKGKSRTGERLEDFYDIDPNPERFNEKNSLFHRTRWDPTVQEYLHFMAKRTAEHKKNNDPGFRSIDYAMRTAAWALVDATKSGTITRVFT